VQSSIDTNLYNKDGTIREILDENGKPYTMRNIDMPFIRTHGSNIYMRCPECGKIKYGSNFLYLPKTSSGGSFYPMCEACANKVQPNDMIGVKKLLEDIGVTFNEKCWIYVVLSSLSSARIASKSTRTTGFCTTYYGLFYGKSEQDMIDFINNNNLQCLVPSMIPTQVKFSLRQEAAKEILDREIHRDYDIKNNNVKPSVVAPMVSANVDAKTNIKEEVKAKPLTVQDLAQSQEHENRLIDDVTLSEANVIDSLTKDDIQYLGLKWGTTYKASEWVKMENLYQQYASEYEMSVDREQVLKNICKVSIKMDQALDIGDVKSYKDLSATYDTLRKSARFTDAQKSERKARDIDSIGELVSYVELKGGAIPSDIDPIDEPQDKVDFIIKDMKNYVDNLVKNELGLSSLIESFIKKSEQNRVQSVDDIIQESFKTDEEIAHDRNESFQEFMLNEIGGEPMMFGADDDGA
jgi:hypothetical protein